MTDTQQEIKCPACGKVMTKVFINSKGINLDICTNGCGGIYFDNSEIQEFSSENDNISEITSVLLNKNFMPVDMQKKRICPACNTPMVKTFAFGIEIETCYKCGGIFLDYGEFEKVRTHFKKHQKVKQLNLNTNNDIDIEKFLKEAEYEKYSYRVNNADHNLLGSNTFKAFLKELFKTIYYF